MAGVISSVNEYIGFGESMGIKYVWVWMIARGAGWMDAYIHSIGEQQNVIYNHGT